MRLLIVILVIYLTFTGLVEAKKNKGKKKKGKKGKKGKKKNSKTKKTEKLEGGVLSDLDDGDLIRMCQEHEYNMKTCLSKNYKAKWLKCAERNYKIVTEGIEREVDEAINLLPSKNGELYGYTGGLGPLQQSGNYIRPLEISGSSSLRGKRSLDGAAGTLDAKGEKGCRQTERKIQKLCKHLDSLFGCDKLNHAITERRIEVSKAKGAIPGGILPGDLSNPNSLTALKKVAEEFKRRAYASGNMEKNETLIIGDLISLEEQVVAGQLYNFTLELGITDDPTCMKKSASGVVGGKNCDDRERYGVGTLVVVHQLWMRHKDPSLEWRWYDYYTKPGEAPSRDIYWVLSPEDEFREEWINGTQSSDSYIPIEEGDYYDGYVVDGAEDRPVMMLGNHGPQQPNYNDDDEPEHSPVLLGSAPLAPSDNKPAHSPVLLGSFNLPPSPSDDDYGDDGSWGAGSETNERPRLMMNMG